MKEDVGKHEKWDNLFWFQRNKNNDKENEKPQLENNTTKGFLKVLKELKSNSVVEALLTKIGVNKNQITNSINYDLQVPLNSIPSSNSKIYLVGLSHQGKYPKEGGESEISERERIDGKIEIEREKNDNIIVAIEVKTKNDTLNPKQMNRYEQHLSPVNRSDRLIRWNEIYKLFDNKIKRVKSEKDEFLLKEFTTYLEMMDMVPFKGFDREKLKENYIKYIRSRKQLQATQKGTLGSFAREISKCIEEGGDYVFDGFTIESNQDNTNLHIFKSKEDKSRRHLNHFTIGFWRDHLNLHLNIRRKLIKKVNKRGRKAPRNEFASVLIDNLPKLADTELSKENPAIYNRLQRNFQQKRQRGQKTTAMDLYEVIFFPEIKDKVLGQEIENLARVNRETHEEGLGNIRCLALAEKRIPFSSEFIISEKLPKYCLDYLEKTFPIYQYFEQ